MTERTPYDHLPRQKLLKRLVEALQRNARQRATIQRLRIERDALREERG